MEPLYIGLAALPPCRRTKFEASGNLGPQQLATLPQEHPLAQTLSAQSHSGFDIAGTHRRDPAANVVNVAKPMPLRELEAANPTKGCRLQK